MFHECLIVAYVPFTSLKVVFRRSGKRARKNIAKNRKNKNHRKVFFHPGLLMFLTYLTVAVRTVFIFFRFFLNFLLDVDLEASAQIEKPDKGIGNLLPEIVIILDEIGRASCRER